MALINPMTLKSRIQTAISNTPRLVRESLEESNLEEINIDNLQKGLDSEGNEMPYYSDQSEYGYEKFMRNPKNGGRWDLKNTGQFYSGINVKITINRKRSEVFFKQKYNNKKTQWLEDRLTLFGSNRSLGITEEQMYEAQLKNKPKIRKSLDRIINGV